MQTHQAFNSARTELERELGWSIILGILLMLLGVGAIASPLATSFGVELFLGWLFIMGGIFQLVYAFQTRGAGPFFLRLILSLLYGGAGFLLLRNPIAGVLSVTLLVGIFFFTDGVLRIIMAFQIKMMSTRAWVLLNGFVTLVLGILIWSQWPFDAAWVLGLLVGIGLLTSGLSTIMASVVARKALQVAAQSEQRALERT